MALLIGTGGIGCSSSTAPFANVRVETTVAPTNGVAPPVMVTTTITNASLRTISIETNLCPHRFRIEMLTGVRIGPPGQVCTLISMPRALAPGQSFSFHDQWDGTDSTGVRVSGTYRVIGQPFLDSGPQGAPVTIRFPE